MSAGKLAVQNHVLGLIAEIGLALCSHVGQGLGELLLLLEALPGLLSVRELAPLDRLGFLVRQAHLEERRGWNRRGESRLEIKSNPTK